MKTRTTKLITLCLTFLLTVLPMTSSVSTASASEIIATGECGEDGANAVYTLDSDGLFAVSGTGRMSFLTWPSIVPPWVRDYGDQIKSVLIFTGITQLGSFTFYQAASLKSVTIDNGVTKIEGSCFRECTNLERITIPQSVEVIQGACFASCTSLKTIAFPGLRILGDGALNDTTSLDSVYFSADLVDIGQSVFQITGLKDVYYGGSESDWNSVNIQGNNNALKNATIHYNCSYEDYLLLQQTLHSVVETENGIRVEISTASENYVFRNHLLYDEYENQFDDVKAEISITNVDNDKLETETLYCDVFLNEFSVELIVINSLNKGKTYSTMCSVGFSIERMLEGDFSGLFKVSGLFGDETIKVPLFHKDVFYVKWDQSAENYIKNYQFGQDNFAFKNRDVADPIDINYYKAAFGPIKGTEFYNDYEDGDDRGRCFGLAASSLAFLEDPAKAKAFGNNTVNELGKDDYNYILDLQLNQFITYMHLLQYSKKVENDRKHNKGFEKVFSYISKRLNNNLGPVPIDLFILKNSKKTKGHTVLAVGLDGSDILVYDSNDPDSVHRIVKYSDNRWEYSCAGNTWDSSNGGIINYVSELPDVYQLIASDNLKDLSYNQNLIVTHNPDVINDHDKKLTGIYGTYNTVEDDEPYTNLFWLDNFEVNAVNETAALCEVKMLEDTRSLFVSIPVNSSVNMAIEPEKNAIMTMQTSVGTEVSFTYSEVFDNQILDVQVSGTAADKNVNMKENETGLAVTGLNGLTVSIVDENGQTLAETSADVTDGQEINVFVDKEQKQISTDYTESEQSDGTPDSVQPDEGNERKCKYCNEVHHGFWGKIVQFIHSILYFFAHLFGKM